jgi:hypothetical protein
MKTFTDKGSIAINENLIYRIIFTMAKNLTNMPLQSFEYVNNNQYYYFEINYKSDFNSTFITDTEFLSLQLTKLIKTNLNINSLVVKIHLEN